MTLRVRFGRVNKILILLMYVPVLNLGKEAAAGAVAGAAIVPACQRRCGDVDVPFPFGLKGDDPSCYLHLPPVMFSLTCNTSFLPPKLFAGSFETLNITVHNAKLRALVNVSYDCFNASGFNDNLPGGAITRYTTYTFSYTDNIYVGIGCDTQAEIIGLTNRENIGDISTFNYTGGCTSSCHSLDEILDGDCSGIGCCQTSIPKGLWGYISRVNSSNNHRDVLDFNPCGYSFLVEKNNYTFKVADLKDMPRTRQFPIVWDWYVGTQSCEIAVRNRTTYACISDQSQCINSTNGPGYICGCSPGYQGNPYEVNGCQDINECRNPESCHRGAVCINTPGNYSCTCPPGTIGDPYLYGCDKMPQKQTRMRTVLGITVGISCGLGILLLLVGMTFMRKRLIKERLQIERQRILRSLPTTLTSLGWLVMEVMELFIKEYWICKLLPSRNPRKKQKLRKNSLSMRLYYYPI